MYKKYIAISLFIFMILTTLNVLRVSIEFKTYSAFHLHSNQQELISIIAQQQQISNALFENIINTPTVINLFANAYLASDQQKARIRSKLYTLLSDKYQRFQQYGIQQLHFHLPNNDSFLRLHQPSRFGDNLSQIRKSVAYVNTYQKPIYGFEVGKMFNGYRYVSPLFDQKQNHIGSVELSSSLLNLKRVYQETTKNRHMDSILLKKVVHQKHFSTQRKSYKLYYALENFLIQDNLQHHNEKNCKYQNILRVFFDDKSIVKRMNKIDTHIFSKLIGTTIYTLYMIPLHNDFLDKEVGYTVILSPSDYLDYFSMSIIGSSLTVLLFSIFIGLGLFLYKRSLILQEEKRQTQLDNEYLLNSSQLTHAIINATDDLIYYKDNQAKYIGCNRAFEKFLGKSQEEIIGKDDFELFDHTQATHFKQMDELMLQKDKTSYNYEWGEYPNGNQCYLYTQKIPLRYDQNNPKLIGVLAISRDLTQLYFAQKKIKAQTYTDELTGLNNRKSYNKRMEEMLELHERYQTPFSMLLYDIDNFKSINDTYGHNVGDRVLVQMSQLIKKSVRKNDYIFRIGGEEFVILFSETTISDAYKIAQKIRDGVEKNLHTIANRTITISIGLTQVAHGDSSNSIFQRVDRYLYYAKEHGKNRVISYVIGDLIFAYYYDEKQDLIYERISGEHINMNAFKQTLMNREFMQDYTQHAHVITDMRDLNVNPDHYENELTQIFSAYMHYSQEFSVKREKSATLIHSHNNEKSISPFDNFLKQQGVQAQTFGSIEEISIFMGYDTQRYFDLELSQMRIYQ